MKKALVFNGEVVDMAENEFPVSPEMEWIDAEQSTRVGDKHSEQDGFTKRVIIPPDVYKQWKIDRDKVGMDEISYQIIKSMDLQQRGRLDAETLVKYNQVKALKNIKPA